MEIVSEENRDCSYDIDQENAITFNHNLIKKNKRFLDDNDNIEKKVKKEDNSDSEQDESQFLKITKKQQILNRKSKLEFELQKNINMFREKLSDEIDEIGVENVMDQLKPNCMLWMDCDGNPIILMKCANINCKDKWKERTPKYFSKGNGGKIGYLPNLDMRASVIVLDIFV